MNTQNQFGIREVVQNDCCIGCGACAFAAPESASLSQRKNGLYTAELESNVDQNLDEICPFSDNSTDEDTLGAQLYGDLPHSSDELGRYLSLFAGRVTSNEMRINSSSGGLVSWVASRLMQTEQVDGVIHVKSNSTVGDPLFAYGLSYSVQDILSNRKSVYYPVEFSGALADARRHGGRFAFIGIPCHIKAIRHLQATDQWAREHIVFTIGLVCGHMKTAGFAESLAWQVGVEPQNLLNVDFRVKDVNAPANRYKFSATSSKDLVERERPNFEMVGSNWGHAFFQPNACNYCDDVFAECADIGLGDAWLPRYQSDPLGHNVVVVRSKQIASILSEGSESGDIYLESLSEAEAVQTQAGNIRHRRIGLSVRLADDEQIGVQHPKKRVSATYSTASEKRIRLVRLRRLSSSTSLTAFQAAKERNSLPFFIKQMRPLMRQYDLTSAEKRSSRIISILPLRAQARARQWLTRFVSVRSTLRRNAAD